MEVCALIWATGVPQNNDRNQHIKHLHIDRIEIEQIRFEQIPAPGLLLVLEIQPAQSHAREPAGRSRSFRTPINTELQILVSLSEQAVLFWEPLCKMRLYNVRLVSRRSFVAVSTGSVGRGGVQALESMQQQTLCAAGKRASGTLLSATTVHRHVSVICLVSLTLVVASTHANKASNAIHPQNSRKFFRNKSMKGSEQSESKSVRIESLPLDQLRMLQKQIAQELEGKQKAAQVLASTASSFNSSRSAVQDLSKVEEGGDACIVAKPKC